MKPPQLDISAHCKTNPFFEEMGVYFINEDVYESDLFTDEFIDLIVISSFGKWNNLD